MAPKSSWQDRGRYWLVVLVTSVVVALGATAFSATLWWRQRGRPAIDPGDSTQVALGKSVYAQQCASCHGDKLQGQPNWKTRLPNGLLPAPPHDETGHTWHHPDGTLFEITKDGLVPPHAPEGYQSAMPAFGEVLTDEESAAVLAYIKSTWPPKALQRQQRVTVQAER